MNGKSIITAALVAATVSFAHGASAGQWVEVPVLKSDVDAGKLPHIAERVPENPRVIDLAKLGRKTGKYGGQIRMLMGKQKDVKMMTVYGYARLVGFNEKFELVADILESYEVEDGRIFTFHLRPGHKWSDGHPLTSEDFRYYWEDVANNEELSRGGPPRQMLVDGKPPKVEYPDATTVRYTWEAPNPEFLPALAGASPLFIYKPKHYLKQFHPKYQDAAKLEEMVKASNLRGWTSLHFRNGRQYRPENPDMPTLQPWHNTTKPPAQRFVFARNPFFHRVDTKGHQLPYLDEVVLYMGSTSLIPAKAGAGETDLQARYIRFDNFTFLKQSEERNDIKVHLWRTAKGSQVALFPNLNTEDPAWRKLMRDVRFRRALSLGINREEINEVIYYGLARVSADTILPDSPLYNPKYQEAYSAFDTAKANALLDDMGMTERDSDGIRLMPNGEALEVVVTTAGESTEETDVLELIRDTWKKIGVKLFTQSSQREVFRNRVFSGSSHMAIWSGLSNAVPTPEMSPWELAPTTQQQLQWPMWGQHFETGGKAGREIDADVPKQLLGLFKEWQHAKSKEEQAEVWQKMLGIYCEQVFSIGIVNGTRQPVVVSNRLRNVPEEGIYNWDPGSYFGVYLLDAVWHSGK